MHQLPPQRSTGAHAQYSCGRSHKQQIDWNGNNQLPDRDIFEGFLPTVENPLPGERGVSKVAVPQVFRLDAIAKHVLHDGRLDKIELHENLSPRPWRYFAAYILSNARGFSAGLYEFDIIRDGAAPRVSKQQERA